VEFLFLDEDERLRRFTDGALDVANTLPDRSLAELRGMPGKRILPQPQLAVRFIVTIPKAAGGAAAKALADPRVRRAMLLALDRSNLANDVLQGNAVVATQYVHPSVFGFDPTIPPVPYDPTEARRLLRDAGFRDGFDLTFAHGDFNPQVIRCLLEDWLAVGIRVRTVKLPFPDVLRSAREGRYPLVMLSRTATTGDASEILDSMFHTRVASAGLGGGNNGDYSDELFDRLDEAAATELDPQKRMELLQRAQRRALETLPILPLFVPWTYVGVSNRLDIVIRFDEWMPAESFRWR
jgi:peptide/nickel transport system substrate-binding protein